MANTENLKPFKPGQSGNPKGRPKGAKNLATVIADLLGRTAPDSIAAAKFVNEFIAGKRKAITNADALAAQLLYQAIVKGSPKHIAEINKLCGNYAPTKLAHEGELGFELVIRDESSRPKTD